MSRTQRGSKPAGYEYWSKRPGNKSGNLLGPGSLAKKLTHSRERLRGNKLQYAGAEEDAELFLCGGQGELYDSNPEYIQHGQV